MIDTNNLTKQEKKETEKLNEAKRLYETANSDQRYVLECLFPELSELGESEDERIRKNLITCISTFKHPLFSERERKEFLAWLEKQGKQEQDPCEHCNDICLNCHNFPCIKKRAFEQGKSVWEIINEEKVDNANKVVAEPKFKVGDWITDGEKVWKIGYIEDDTYIEHCDLISAGGFIESIDKHYHLWSIEDAKAGDILVDVYGNIGIFEKRYGINWHTYCYLGNEGRFISEGGSHGSICYPATKEQRDLLFQKMKEAGFEWDADKKEPKKIEQKPTKNIVEIWKDMRLEVYQQASGNRHESNYSDDTTKMFSLNDIDEIIEKMSEQNPTDEEMVEALRTEYEKGRADAIAGMQVAWSDKDKVMLDEIIDFFENGTVKLQHDLSLYASCLKSLKDRVQPQLKQEWSEEDEKMLADACIMLDWYKGNNWWTAQYIKDWLKSLKDKCTWKPSEEQMNDLKNAINSFTFENDYLQELYEDLKKLK